MAGRLDHNLTLLQRVIMPRATDPIAVRPLYFDERGRSTGRAELVNRSAITLPASSGMSFAAYFNAFPAAYWRHWTSLADVLLQVQVAGRARIDIYRSSRDGSAVQVTGAVVEDGVGEFVLDFASFSDGGWYWFDVATDDRPATILDSGWFATVQPERAGKAAVGICTFNRPEDCVAALRALGEDQVVLAELSAVFVIDQGERKVVDEAGFAGAEAVLGDRLQIIDQRNLGGSGGFSRAMYETLRRSDADHLLVLDDDIVLEPDAVRRALAFAWFARNVGIVGGQMLALQNRSVLHSMGEVIDLAQFSWQPATGQVTNHDFAQKSLRETAELHRRVDVAFNGWWMCLMPRPVLEKIGLPLPLFIKWDDAEFGLRAACAGIPTVSLPGVAVWHMSWTDKDDVVDWQAYFHVRNRLIVAALYSPHRDGGTLPRQILKATLVHLLTLNYSAAALHHQAVADFLEGPGGVPDLLPTAMSRIGKIRASYGDGVVHPCSTAAPLPATEPRRADRLPRRPGGRVALGIAFARALAQNIKPLAEHDRDAPQVRLAAHDARWFVLSRVDRAIVYTVDGRGFTVRRRNPRLFWAQLRQALADYLRLRREFPGKRTGYRAALGELTSVETWQRLFQS